MLQRQGKLPEALEKFKMAREILTTHAPYSMTLSGVHYKIGTVYADQGWFKQAR